MAGWLLAGVVGVVAYVLTGWVRGYALAKDVLDIPNARSSHSVPTPRGGGVAIVLSVLLALVILGAAQWLPWPVVFGLTGAGAGVALLGFLDDHGHIAARWRLLGHVLAVLWGLYWLGGVPPITLWTWRLDVGVLGACFVVVAGVWLLNLYNFMDGIDGLASVEAIGVCVGGALLYALLGMPVLAVAPLVLAAAVAGFLCWNLPPAKIFMGDAGSGFLGVMLALLALQAAWFKTELLWSWLILLAVFVVDATFTLVRRLLRGEKVYEAHRTHAYQQAARRVGAHWPVTVVVALINTLGLLPLALAVGLDYLSVPLGMALAYVPLALLAIRFNAGGVDHG